jgi:hypothetical protein
VILLEQLRTAKKVLSPEFKHVEDTPFHTSIIAFERSLGRVCCPSAALLRPMDGECVERACWRVQEPG